MLRAGPFGASPHRAVPFDGLRDIEPYLCGRLDQALYLMTRT